MVDDTKDDDETTEEEGGTLDFIGGWAVPSVGNDITGLECFQVYLASQDFEEVIGPAVFLAPGEFMRSEDESGTRIILGHNDVGDPATIIEFHFDTDGRLIGYGGLST